MMANLHINALVRPLQSDTVQQSRSLLKTLFFAVAVVLLIACFNLAGLMLVRAIRRQREVAVRLASAPAAWLSCVRPCWRVLSSVSVAAFSASSAQALPSRSERPFCRKAFRA